VRWTPITRSELDDLLIDQLADCPSELRAAFVQSAIAPQKWSQFPYGDEGGGFWAVAVLGSKVLWYNDIEDGFNVSHFAERGRIPDDEYWCEEDPLKWALPRLIGDPPGWRKGAPRPMT
jgi:hypothetical protein